MAVSVGGVSSASANSATLAWSHTIGLVGNLLLVGLCLDDGITASGGVTYGATAMTLLRRDTNAGAATTEIWYLDNVLTSETITASLSAKAQSIGGAVDFAGALTAPDNATGSTPDGVSSVSNTVTGVGADDFVFDCTREPGAALTVGANQTAQWDISAGGEHGGGSTQDGVDGGVMSWSNGTTDWAHTACRIPAVTTTPVSNDQQARFDLIAQAEATEQARLDLIGVPESTAQARFDMGGVISRDEQAHLDLIATAEATREARLDLIAAPVATRLARFDARGVLQEDRLARLDLQATVEATEQARFDLIVIDLTDIQVACGTFTTPAGTGVTAVVSGLAFQPKAYILFGAAVKDETININASMHMGMSDGVASKATAVFAAQSPADTRRQQFSTSCLSIHTSDAVPVSKAAHDSFQSDGFSLDFETSESGFIVGFIAFGGAALKAACDERANNASPVSGLGFKPDIVFAMTAGAASGSASPANNSFGVFTETDEWWVGQFHGQNSSANRDSVLQTTGFIGKLSAAEVWEIALSTMDSGGFSWTGGTDTDLFFFLALQTGNRAVEVTTFTKEVTGGDPVSQDLPDLGFTPQAYGLASAGETDQGTGSDNGAKATLGVYDGTNQKSLLITSELDVDNCDMRSNNENVLMIGDVGAVIDAGGTAQAISDSTPTVEWSPNDTVAYIIGVWGIEKSALVVSQDQLVHLDLIGVPESTEQARFDMGGVISRDEQAHLDLIATAEATREALFDMLGGPVATRLARFDARGVLQEDRLARLDLQATVEATEQARFDMLIAAEATRQARLDLIAVAQATREARFDMTGVLQEDRLARFDMQIPVEATQQALFDMLQGVDATRQALFDLIGSLREDRLARFDARGVLQEDRLARFDLQGVLQTIQQARFDMGEAVVATRQARADLLARAEATREALFDLLGGPFLEALVRMDIRGLLTVDALVRFDMKAEGGIIAIRQARFDLIAQIEAIREARFDLEGGAAKDMTFVARPGGPIFVARAGETYRATAL